MKGNVCVFGGGGGWVGGKTVKRKAVKKEAFLMLKIRLEFIPLLKHLIIVILITMLC